MNSQNNAQLSRLAEALFRFSAGLDESLAPHVRQVAVELAGAVAAFDEAGIERALGRAQGVVGLGKQVGIIAESDAEVIAGAINRSKTIAVPKPAKQIAQVSVAEFAGIAQEQAGEQKVAEVVKPEAAAVARPVVREVAPVAAPAIERREVAAAAMPVAREAIAASPSAVDRQEQIIGAIRRNPNARMRDLLAALPGVSERTIRYDLERLVASGKIEREGVGGPATWYRVRASVTTH